MKTFGFLRRHGSQWEIDALPHVHMRAKRLFGRLATAGRGTLRLSATPEIAADLAWFLARYPMTITPADQADLEAGAAAHRETVQRLEDLVNPNYAPPTFQLAKPARSYQARQAAVLLAHGGLLSGDDVGLGKTVTAICAMTDPRALPAIVVCPTHLPRQWAVMIQEFAPDLFVHVVKKGQPYPLPVRGALVDGRPRTPDVLVLNYHKLAGWVKVLSAYGQYVVFDEVQELRHAGSARYAAAANLCAAVPYRLGLSATPIHNYGSEIFNILNVLKPGALGEPQEFFTEWATRPDARGRAKLRDPHAFGAWAREQFLIMRHRRAEVGRELPAVLRVTQVVETDRRALDGIRSSAAALARMVLATEALERGAKWQASEQLSTLLRQATGIAKAPYVADFVRLLVESGERVVLCGWHREVYGIWQDRLADLKPRLYTGTETAAEKDAAAQAFIAGDTPVLMLSLRSGAGLNGLQAASSCIVFGELDWSPAVHEQCIGRLARDGQTSPVAAYFLMAEDGADPAIAEILGLKREQLEGIRNPGQEFLEQVDTTGQHVQRLAAAYLKQIGARVPDSGAA